VYEQHLDQVPKCVMILISIQAMAAMNSVRLRYVEIEFSRSDYENNVMMVME